MARLRITLKTSKDYFTIKLDGFGARAASREFLLPLRDRSVTVNFVDMLMYYAQSNPEKQAKKLPSELYKSLTWVVARS